ncbi:TraX family protein [uncultured Clostridium sp.]|uniref:TraX family protein n=1 Tax=uncultured Clostridium sp. TaxID=59620 RepID=UPI0028EA5C5B|nr:TraX family protein [uncultured Clostridium sp.]
MNTSISEKKELSRKRGLSGSTLKIMAVISMLIDHIAAVLILMGIYYKFIPYAENTAIAHSSNLNTIYLLMRAIGRISFPIFCFLLVEGYIHTSNKKKYALRLFIFALISEIPFNLAFGNKMFIPASRLNNVFFTLFLGICVMYIIEFIKSKEINKVVTAIGIIATIVVFGVIAKFIKCDFNYYGILCISLFYIFRENRILQILSGIIVFLYQAPGSFGIVYLSLLAIYFYNGERGLNTKYFFYVFYPAHLLILYFIRLYLATMGV